MQDLLEMILKDIVNHPEDIKTEEQVDSTDPTFVKYLIYAHDEDKGLIIGKGGRIISAIRDVLSIKAVRENKKVRLEIVD
ncbi:MAG: KH domain-containing protein [Candidatus Dojkabacteria bacterium]|nr:KH domain-containing protein [Candidatus Dojkabacteria bacterium]